MHDSLLHENAGRSQLFRYRLPSVDTPDKNHFAGFRRSVSDLLCDKFMWPIVGGIGGTDGEPMQPDPNEGEEAEETASPLASRPPDCLIP